MIYCQTMIRRSNVNPSKTISSDVEGNTEEEVNLKVSNMLGRGWVKSGDIFARVCKED